MQCVPAKVKEDEHLGRYMEATREIKAGDILLKEKPLVTGPTQVSFPFRYFRANFELYSRYNKHCLFITSRYSSIIF